MLSSSLPPASTHRHITMENPYDDTPLTGGSSSVPSLTSTQASKWNKATLQTHAQDSLEQIRSQGSSRSESPVSAASSAKGMARQRGTSTLHDSPDDGLEPPRNRRSSSAAATASPPASSLENVVSSRAPAHLSRRAQNQSNRTRGSERQRRLDGRSPRVPTTRALGSSTVPAADPRLFHADAQRNTSRTVHRSSSRSDRAENRPRLSARATSPSVVSSTSGYPVRPSQTASLSSAPLTIPRDGGRDGTGTEASGSTQRDRPASVAAGSRAAATEAGGNAPGRRSPERSRVRGYVAQSAYAQKNPFRQQDFAEFAANPQYGCPADFNTYAQAMATRVYGLEVSRATQGEFMMQRLVKAAHPSTAVERAEMKMLLTATLEKLQVGDWFYKWTRIHHVHHRYVWLNLQRGTLMWSLSPKQSSVLNSEIRLSTVIGLTADCLQMEAPARVFYRMTVDTPDRCVSLATEIWKKFDVWYRVLVQLTAPNLTCGVPGVWGRPSSSVNSTGDGTLSRWATRYSPLMAILNDTRGTMSTNEVYACGPVQSSD